MTETLSRRSPEDSARFGIRIARARLEDDDDYAHQLCAEMELNGTDLLILRLPAGMHSTPRSLVDCGSRVIHADTLVYYETKLADTRSSTYTGTAHFSVATPRHANEIATVAADSFSNYRSHYHASPNLKQELIARGYVEWATSYATHGSESRLTYVAKIDDSVVGFVAADLDAERRICDVVLNAVSPTHEGQGIYGEALGRLMNHAMKSGYETATISTQIWNYRVQRVWTRLGLQLTRAYDTYHVSRRI